jgi:hypothetical protein
MSALISDVLEARVTPQICNAAVNAGGKLLTVVEMQQKYGNVSVSGGSKELILFNQGASSRLEMLEAEIKSLRAELD